MTMSLFQTFAEASSFAKRMTLEGKATVFLSRCKDGFIVESKSLADVPILSGTDPTAQNSSLYEASVEPNEASVAGENNSHECNIPTIEEAKLEIERIFNASWKGDSQICFERDLVYGAGRWFLDFFFNQVRMGVVVDDEGGRKINKQLFIEVEQELELEKMGITLVRFTVDEIYGNVNTLTSKLKKTWEKSLAVAEKTARSMKQRHVISKPVSRINKKLKAGVTEAFTGGWTTLSQGKSRMGDSTCSKQYINEGIAGTRSECKTMKKNQFADMKKRSRGY